MKKTINILLVLLFAFSAMACNNAQSNNSDSENNSEEIKKVEVYYFHGDRRCATCKAVGDVSSKLVANKYGDNPNVEFIEINVDEPGNEELIKKFQVTGSALYVYNGTDIEDITGFAFQHARNSPNKLRNKLIELIDKNLK